MTAQQGRHQWKPNKLSIASRGEKSHFIILESYLVAIVINVSINQLKSEVLLKNFHEKKETNDHKRICPPVGIANFFTLVLN